MSKLTITERKEAIRKLLEEQNDLGLLNEIYALLKPENDPILRKKLTKAIQEAEENISKGEVYSIEEVLRRTNDTLKK